jgi:hypothetical protein
MTPEASLAWIKEAQQAIAAEVAAASGAGEVRMTSSLRYTLHTVKDGKGGGEPCLEARCFGRLIPATVPLKLTGFREQWRAEVLDADTVPQMAGKSHGITFAFFVRISASLWQRCIGRQPGIEVQLTVRPPGRAAESLTELHVRMVPRDLGGERALKILDEVGPKILESLKDYLQLHTERRGEPRFPYTKAVQVYPVLASGELGTPLLSQGKDLSSRGMALYLPSPVASSSIRVQIAPADEVAVMVPARIIHTHPCPDGRIEAGLCFAWGEISSQT